jgi:D-lactate dehydrogenase
MPCHEKLHEVASALLQHVGFLLQGIGMEVVAYDIQKNPAVEAMGVKYVDMEEALPWADVVSVHVPLLKSTHHFINGDRCVDDAAMAQ